jgi:CRISPR-associated exonuclease Cas4
MTRPLAQQEIVLVSSISHFSYCQRRSALIHVEHVFEENVYTVRGSMAHERADEPGVRTEHGGAVERALPIWSEVHSLQGKADVVEFRPDGSIFPVEYKHGENPGVPDDLQLCAQAICLEEMFSRPVSRGAIYSSSTHVRRDVEFTEDLRRQTISAVQQVRRMIERAETPGPVDDQRCPSATSSCTGPQ